MIKRIFNYYFPPIGDRYRRINEVPVLVTYILIGLFAFGHNYVNYPVMDGYKQRVWVRTIDQKGEEIESASGWSEEAYSVNQPDVALSGLKATAVGLFWPAYIMVLINEKLK